MSRLAVRASAGDCWSKALACSLVNKFPILTPNRFAPFARWIPAGEFGAQEARVGGFVCEPPHSGQPNIDCGGRQLLLLQEEAVSEEHRPVERQAWLRAVPADKLVDCVTVRFLRTCRGERIQHRVFRLLWVGEPKHCFGLGPFRYFLPTGHTGGLLRRGSVW